MRQDRVGGQLAQPDLCGKWLLKSSTGSVWVTSCLENLKMSENLAPVRKISRENFFREKCHWLTSSLQLRLCLVHCCGPYVMLLKGFFCL